MEYALYFAATGKRFMQAILAMKCPRYSAAAGESVCAETPLPIH